MLMREIHGFGYNPNTAAGLRIVGPRPPKGGDGLMDLLIALLKLAGAVLSLAAGVIRFLSATSESGDETDGDR